MKYAKDNGLKTVCVTDHFWDESIETDDNWYRPQNYQHVVQSKPLPQTEGVRFLFGCETELNRFLTLGISPEKYDLFDFIIAPTTHMHNTYALLEEELVDAKSRAKAWVKRLDAVLNMDLPFHKVGIPHLTCGLIAPTREELLEVFTLLPQEELIRLFTKAAKLGVGIELNSCDMDFKDEEADTVLRIYRIAKKCNCKFYCGSDAHHPETLDNAKRIFERAIDLLELTEDDKFII